MKYEIQFTSQFKKDLKLAKKQNKDIDKLMSVIEKIARGESLEAKFNDILLCQQFIHTHSLPKL